MRQAAPSPAQDGIREVLWKDGDRVLSRVWRSDADGGPEVVLRRRSTITDSGNALRI
jgi:hypothetical protein